ncbi:apolipoprotein L3-like [Boleophthalmus pectinirostris]|uniref:apolipoprotein L3-like n=1 Tax=Boleophthalmus pectinirostris TaxID=150288 RepID=UPI00242D3082|nr:apolipoprotein L3-like [Boleophthalmus pectinirostris]
MWMKSLLDMCSQSSEQVLRRYVSDTYRDVGIVQSFIKTSEQWIKDRQREAQNIDKVSDSEELRSVLKPTLNGLKDMQRLLEAMERLAVTSVHVFQRNHNPVMGLSSAANRKILCEIIKIAGVLCPLLLLFKQDQEKFFCPEVLNKDVLQNQLQCYIRTMRIICDTWKSSNLNKFSMKQPNIYLEDLSEDDIKKMTTKIRDLRALRDDPHFRMVNLFKDHSQDFRQKFSELKPQMKELMNELEDCARQLDSMNHGARVSGVVSSSVGIISGGLSILGLVLTPFTAGASLALSAAGAGLGVTSGVQGLVTTATEIEVNDTQRARAEEAFNKCVKLMNELQDFLYDVIHQHFKCLHEKGLRAYAEAIYAGAIFADNLTGLGSIIYKRMAGEVIEETAELARAGAAARRVGSRGLRLAKCAKIGTGVLNGIFAVVDGYFLYKDAKSLAEGTETELSRWIRARTALWSSEIEAWQEIHDSVNEGEKVSEKYKEKLQQAFYP